MFFDEAVMKLQECGAQILIRMMFEMLKNASTLTNGGHVNLDPIEKCNYEIVKHTQSLP